MSPFCSVSSLKTVRIIMRHPKGKSTESRHKLKDLKVLIVSDVHYEDNLDFKLDPELYVWYRHNASFSFRNVNYQKRNGIHIISAHAVTHFGDWAWKLNLARAAFIWKDKQNHSVVWEVWRRCTYCVNNLECAQITETNAMKQDRNIPFSPLS